MVGPSATTEMPDRIQLAVPRQGTQDIVTNVGTGLFHGAHMDLVDHPYDARKLANPRLRLFSLELPFHIAFEIDHAGTNIELYACIRNLCVPIKYGPGTPLQFQIRKAVGRRATDLDLICNPPDPSHVPRGLLGPHFLGQGLNMPGEKDRSLPHANHDVGRIHVRRPLQFLSYGVFQSSVVHQEIS